jgi:DNA-directed RNA polymerase subunit H (RpoH/RPB5)
MASQNISSIISSIYISRKNVLDLMEKQDYNVSDYKNFSINEINTMFQNNQLDMLIEKSKEEEKNKRKNKIYIKYYLGKVLRPSNIQEIIDDLFYLEEILLKEDTLFIIAKDEMNETLTNELIHLFEKDGIFIVVQSIKGLQFNILEHALVPPHRVLSDFETQEIMEKYNLKNKSEFPDISRFDPVAQVIGLRPGKVCEITRTSKTSVFSKYYRVCM